MSEPTAADIADLLPPLMRVDVLGMVSHEFRTPRYVHRTTSLYADAAPK
jgi:hypothetical protein